MRDLLTGIAIVLIVALTTMLVAPYFVDWNGQRSFLEAQLARGLGQKVTIGGNIDLKLLPTPYLRLNQTVIGSDDAAVRIGIRYLDLELAIAPLLHGEIDIVEGRLDEPTIRLTLQPDRTLPALPDTPAFRADIRLERIRIIDGTLAVADPQSGRTFVADHLDFSAEAPNLAGPFKGSGSAGADPSRTKFRFSTTEAKKGKTRLHLALDETLTHPSVDLDGALALDASGSALRQSFDGMFIAAGHLTDVANPISWRLSGPLKADPQNAAFGEGELRVSGLADEGGLAFRASGEGSFGEQTELRLKLQAKQLDIDRLSGAPVNAERPPPPKLPRLADLRRIFTAMTPSVPTTVDVGVGTAIWGGETLSGFSAHLALAGPAPRAWSVAGDGPGGTRIDVHGTIADKEVLQGRLEAAADDLPLALRWLAIVAPELKVPSTTPFRAAEVATGFRTEPGGITFDDVTLGFDRSRLSGSASVAFGGIRPKVTADLKAGSLNFEELPDLRAVGSDALDVALKLDAGAVRIARVGNGSLDVGHLKLDVASTGRHVSLASFEANNLGGATIELRGDADETSTTFTMNLTAARLDGVAALAKQLAPGPGSDALASRAGELAPADLKVEASIVNGGPQILPSRFEMTGHVAATRLDVHLAPAPGVGNVVVKVDAQSDHGTALLRQLGLATVPLELIGPSHLALVSSGPVDRPTETKIEAAFGSVQIAGDGRVNLFGADHGGSGTLTLKSPDAMPLLQSLAIAQLDTTSRLPIDATTGVAFDSTGIKFSDITARVDEVATAGTLFWRTSAGTGPALTGSLVLDHFAPKTLFGLVLGPDRVPVTGATWSNERFSGSLSDPPRGAVALRAKTLDLGFGLTARDAAFDLGTDRNFVTMRHGSAGLAGGRVGFDISLRRDGPQAALEGSFTGQAVRLDLPAIKGELSGKLDVAGAGQSALALVSSLAGTGQATLAKATVTGVSVRALPEIFAEVESDALAVDEESIRRAFEENSRGFLASGTRLFGASLAAGMLALTAQDKPIVTGPVATTLEGSFDLRRFRSAVRVGEQLRDLPRNWTGSAPSIGLTEEGGMSGVPERTFDVSNFVNAVAARAITRESARIEAYEFDIRERALFNARLQADRRREQDRLKAEADAKAAVEAARQAEADRRAKAEAARLEKQRADQEQRDEPPARAPPE